MEDSMSNIFEIGEGIGAVEGGKGCSVVEQFAQILAKASAKVSRPPYKRCTQQKELITYASLFCLLDSDDEVIYPGIVTRERCSRQTSRKG